MWSNYYFCSSLSGQNTHGVTFLFIIDYVASGSSISDCEHWLADTQGESKTNACCTHCTQTGQVEEGGRRWIMNRTCTGHLKWAERERRGMLMKHVKIQMDLKLVESEMVKYFDISAEFTKNQQLSIFLPHSTFISPSSCWLSTTHLKGTFTLMWTSFFFSIPLDIPFLLLMIYKSQRNVLSFLFCQCGMNGFIATIQWSPKAHHWKHEFQNAI